jgi:uncharacterized protein DUF6636
VTEASFPLLATALAAALLIGCGSDGESTVAGGSASTVTETVTQQPDSTFTVARAPSPLRLKQFQSPSGNIGCYMSRQRGGSVRCDIREHSWTAPPKPAYCDVDWGGGLQVGSKRRGSIVCAGDTVLDSGSQVLGYGKTSMAGPIECRSSEAGVRCSNIATGHGFFVSRQRYGLF